MTSKNIKILTQLLNLEGVKVVSHHQYKGIGVILKIESIKTESICPRCGTKSNRLHQNHRYTIKDLPLGEQEVFLEINKRQFKCEKCKKPFTEKLDFVDRRRKYTKRLANKIIQQVIDSDIHSVAKKGYVTTAIYRENVKRCIKKLIGRKTIILKKTWYR